MEMAVCVPVGGLITQVGVGVEGLIGWDRPQSERPQQRGWF